MENGWTTDPPTKTSNGTELDYTVYALAVDFMVALLLGFCVWWDVGSTIVAALSGTAFFGFGIWWVVGNRSGLFAATTMNKQNNYTQIRIEELRYLQHTRSVDVPQLPYVPPVASPNYVPAIEENTRTVRAAALGWAQQLFDETTGERIRNRITPKAAQIQVKDPEPQVVKYLESLDMVRRGGTNLYWNVQDYPTAENVYPSISRGIRLPAVSGGGGRGVTGGI